MNKDKIEKISLLLLGIVSAGIIIIVLVKDLIPVFLPFLIAWFMAYAVRLPSAKISQKLHLSERAVRPIMAIAITLLTFGSIAVIIWQLTGAIWNILSDIGEGESPIYNVLGTILNRDISIFGDSVPAELSEKISSALEELLTSALSAVAGAVTSWVGSLPSVLLFLLVTVIALIYFAIDLEKISSSIRAVLPEKIYRTLSRAAAGFLSVLRKYAISYLLIFLITFTVMSFGLLFMRVKYALLIAFVISLLDILPVIGVGTVLIPWSIFSFILGNIPRGISLIILFVVNAVIRQLAEPKIVGKSLGTHPLVPLVTIYAGYALFGLGGLLLAPILIALVGFLFKKDDAAEIG